VVVDILPVADAAVVIVVAIVKDVAIFSGYVVIVVVFANVVRVTSF